MLGRDKRLKTRQGQNLNSSSKRKWPSQAATNPSLPPLLEPCGSRKRDICLIRAEGSSRRQLSSGRHKHGGRIFCNSKAPHARGSHRQAKATPTSIGSGARDVAHLPPELSSSTRSTAFLHHSTEHFRSPIWSSHAKPCIPYRSTQGTRILSSPSIAIASSSRFVGIFSSALTAYSYASTDPTRTSV
ncbi:uncharacterized protein TrAtP1_004125 [Trichoderma atroviride]|uniref:uncharacterized protein n=1 Tax=Hypocrea atroviridis TaxID=63577 RepID=UPI003326EBFF|nr:hypothetical protein TrAtP1_004125 [Trichoderma atroviride]